MKNKYKEEKYIQQLQSPRTGKWSFRVKVGNTTKTFSQDKYISVDNAWKKAKNFRDELLFKGKLNIVKTPSKSLQDVFYESFDYIVVRSETKRKLIAYYNKYINLDMKIKDVKRADVILTLNNMIEDVSSDTIGRVLSIWKRISQTALIKEYIVKDFTLGVKAPQSHKKPIDSRNKILDRQTLDEIIKCLNEHSMDGKLYSDFILFLFLTGCRPAEAAALTNDKVNLKNKTIYIDCEIGSSIDDKQVVRQTKTPLSRREIPIHEDLIPILKERTKDKIIFSKNGTYLDTTYVGNGVHVMVKRHLNYSFNLYMCRHSFAESLLRNNVDSRTIQELLGHKYYTTSVNYGQSSTKEKRLALESSLSKGV